jgi:DnaJ-class molecular chaperone
MAKKYHPDFQGPDISDADREEASEMFKKVQKAYETLSNPIMRQAYDIEHNLNDGGDGTTTDQSIYEDTLSNKTYFQPKQQKDFYHTKWTGYKKPEWYHPYNGMDARSEFLYLRRNAISWPKLDEAIKFVGLNRLFFYFLAYAAFNIYD